MPTGVHLVPPLPEHGEEVVAALLARAAQRRAGLLLLVEPGRADRAHRALQRARLVVPAARAALRVVDASPLARTVVAALADEVGRGASLGHALAAVDVLVEEVVAVAATRSVAGLGRPAPRLAAHAASWWPGTSFVVHLAPDPAVLRVGRRTVTTIPGLPAPARSRLVAVSGDPARAGRAGAALVATLTAAVAASPAPVADHPAAADVRTFYGTPHVFEVVLAPTDLVAVAARARERCATCTWCGQQSASAVCPLCADATVLAGPPPGAGAGRGGPAGATPGTTGALAHATTPGGSA